MPPIELAIKDAIHRGAGRQIRRATTPLRREVRRLRHLVVELRREMTNLKAIAAQWQRTVAATPWTATVSDEAAKAARLSGGLIQKLRTRFGLSQAALARLLGVTGAAVVAWEQGRATPSGERRKGLVALRGLGRRDVKRLLARVPPRGVRRKARPRTRRRGGRRGH
jgi:DNA-binding transcriptional regulator YiaG